MKDGGTLIIATSVENQGIKVEITDSGSGIAAEIKKRIFEAFFTTKPTGEGSGLGLHISQKIMSESAIICVDDEVVILDSLKKQLKRKFGDRLLQKVVARFTINITILLVPLKLMNY